MGVYLPDFSEALAVSHGRGVDSDNPGAWDDLAAAWPFVQGGGGTLFDLSGRRRDGTLTNMTLATDWVTAGHWCLSRATILDGTNQYIDINSTLGMAGATALSVSAWIKPTIPFADFDGIFSLGSTGNRAPWIFGNSGTAALLVQMETDSGPNDINMTRGTLVDDVWQHVAFTWGAQVGTVYVDGVQAGATDPTTGTIVVTPDANADIGALDGSFHATMQVGPVTVWKNQARSASDVLAQFHDPMAMFRLRTKIFPAAAVVAAGNPWYYYAQQA